jgi:ferredoxin/flavodoxin
MENRIYYFTGTGNSLQTAKTIAETLGDCELVPICKDTPPQTPIGYERIGFVFPNYAGGLPQMVADFIRAVDLPETYLFTVATYGGFSGTVLERAGELLKQKERSFCYGAAIRSYPNLVTAYPMIKGIRFLSKTANRTAKCIAKEIAAKRLKPIPALKESAPKMYDRYMAQIHDSDKNFYVNADCISCGICKSICPANNITMEDGKPVFHHRCESCMACIQYCPKRAINDKDKTENRGRYTNPNITAQDIIWLREELR